MTYRRRSDVQTRTDESTKRHGKMSGESSVDSSSYDATENLTDTDSSAQIKSFSRRMSSSDYNHNHVDACSRSINSTSCRSLNSSSEIDRDATDRVRFALNALRFHEVESHNNFTAKERSKYWWSDREKDRMMAKHERLVAKYEQQKAGAGSKSASSKKSNTKAIQSYRGLESWTAAGSLKLDYTIEQCITAVMDEQDRQWAENADDAEIIAQMSMAVTEDSARRARLNGLQDAQEALKVRSEMWGKVTGDDMSVGSAVSTGTAALVKKKKRSKLLARLDDSAKLKKNSSNSSVDDDALSKKSKDKKKKKKKNSKKKDQSSVTKEKKKSSKAKSSSTKKSPSIGDEQKATEEVAKESLDVADDNATTATPKSGLLSAFTAGPEVPISPLSTHIYAGPSSANSNECPLLATLRRQQEQLRQESGVRNDNKNLTSARSITHLRQYEEEEEDENDLSVSPLLQTLRRQQKKQASARLQEQRADPSSAGALQKSRNSRDDHGSRTGDSESADSSDPPGRRPRRLVSRHVESGIPEEFLASSGDKSSLERIKESSDDRSRSKSRERSSSKPRERSRSRSAKQLISSFSLGSPTTTDETPANPKSPINASKRSLGRLRSSAKTLFKKSSKNI